MKRRVVILGAGASKSYDLSKTGVKMPVALDFFETFRKLDISENPWVLIGHIINYIGERNNTDKLEFLNFSEDIEELHTEIQEKLYLSLKRGEFFSRPHDIQLLKAFYELIFLFANVINEVQNGDISSPHKNLAKQLSEHDTILTFNWDTLMDRALKKETSWNTKTGYFIQPSAIYNDKWIYTDEVPKEENFPKLLKLHGSSNWLTSHIQPSKDGKLELSQETSAEDFYVFERATEPYPTYAGRYMSGYEEFSYGYYPPNLPLKGKPAPEGYVFLRSRLRNPFMSEGQAKDEGLPSMPLIIPPVKQKEYDLFGTLFTRVWREAQEQIEKADEIYVIGYSFPKTDIRTDHLFKTAFLNRDSIPKIIIVNPIPELVHERFLFDYGIPDANIKVNKEYFDDTFKFE